MKTLQTLALTILIFFSPWALAKTYPIARWQTENGAQVVFYEAKEVPMLDLSIAFAAGSAYDQNAFGLSTLTTGLLNEGNGGLNAGMIAEQLADIGAQYQSNTSRDMSVLMLKTLTTPEALKKATALFSLIVSKPDFPFDSFKREKNQQLIAIAKQDDSPDAMADQMFYKLLYKNHPYAHPIFGVKDTVEKITLNDVKKFYKQYFVARNAIIVMVGALDEQTAHAIAETISKDLPTGEQAMQIPRAPLLQEEINMEVKFPSSQTVLRLGQMGIDHHNPNYFPLLVGNYILGGGGLVSLLSTEVREKRGLTYGVYSQFLPMPALGPFVISLSTKNDQALTASDITRKTLEDFIKRGPTEEELVAAKKYLIGSFPLSLGSNRSIAELLLRITFYKLPNNYLETYTDNINAVNKETIRKALAEIITPKQMVNVSVGQK